MSSVPVQQELRSRFTEATQDHVFRFLDAGKVPAGRDAAFLEQLGGLDLAYLESSYKAAMADADASTANLEPPEEYTSLDSASPEQIAAWEKQGLEAVGKGEVVACVLAGGQGTRLGFDGPKGCYNIGLPSEKPLFQLMVERVRRLVMLAQSAGYDQARLPFVIMTSPINDEQTRRFFKENSYFGMSEEDVWFFSQGTLPCLTGEGKIILESAGLVATAPDGNGGFYPALLNSGVMARMKKDGIKYMHVFSVDNSLCRPADPCFVGHCLQKGVEIGNKCVWKVTPEEKVGVVAKRNGKGSVVEYSELDEESKQLRDASGRLVYGAGNICNHFFSVDFLAETVIPNCAGLFHLAHKKIPYAGEDGTTVKPAANNGIKLEAFIFDTFSMTEKMAVLEALREDEFAPVKNAPGEKVDSPDSARAMFSNLCKRWVLEAGGKLEGDEGALLEISPLVSYRGEGLEERVKGKTLTLPFYMQ